MAEKKNVNEQEFNFEKVSHRDLSNLSASLCMSAYLYAWESYGGTEEKHCQKKLAFHITLAMCCAGGGLCGQLCTERGMLQLSVLSF